MFQVNFEVSKAERDAMRCLSTAITNRKWRTAYKAADELRFARARKLDVAAPYEHAPATVTTIIEHKLKLSLRRLMDKAKELP